MRNFLAVTLMFMLLLVSALDCAAADGAHSGGVAALVDLLQKKGLISADELGALRQQAATGGTSRAEIKALTDLLRTKGLINDEEASLFLQSQAVKASPDVAAVTDTQARMPAGTAASAGPVDEDMLRANLNLIFVKQGILGSEEAEQIAERIGRKWSPGDDDEILAAPDREVEYHRTTLPREGLFADIDQLLTLKLVSNDEAERIKVRLTRKLSLERVTDDIGAELRREVKTQVAEKIIPVPYWTKRIKIGGDFRLRFEEDFFDKNNGVFLSPSNPTQLLNSKIDRSQLRIRARLGFTAKVNDEVEAGISLATGNTTNPVSTNATLGDSLNKKSFLVDLAYLKWTPLPDLTLWGGRFANPFIGSDLVWDQDVNFDGVAFSYQPKVAPCFKVFLTGGAFPIQEIEFSGHDKWLLAGQLGMHYRLEEKLTARLAAAFYDFENVTGKANDPAVPGATDWTAPQFQQKGNTLIDIDPGSAFKTAYAAEFRELNIYGTLDLGFWNPVRVVLLADYVNNIGYDRSWVNSLTGHDVKKETQGYQFGVSVGHAKTREAGQWKLLLNYKYLQADAVMDAFAESDFHLGGTNAKGWIIGGDLGVGKNVWLTARWLTTNEISGPPLAIDVLQFNVNARF